MNFQEAVTRFYRRCLSINVSDKTIINYRYQFKALGAYFSSKRIVRMENVTPDDIRGYMAYMRTKGYAPDTIKDRYVGLAALFRFLHEDGLVPGNPALAVKRPKLPKLHARTFTTTELQKMLSYFQTDTFTGLRNKLIMYILYGTGIRRAELLGLTIFSVHLDSDSMTIIGKGDKQREVPLSPQVEKLLRKYLKARAELLLDLSIETSALFVGKWGKPFSEGGLQEVFRELKSNAGVTGFRVSPHTFRHSFAKNFLVNGGNLFALQEIMGHEDVSTTRIYVEYSKQELSQQMRNYSPIENSKWSYLV